MARSSSKSNRQNLIDINISDAIISDTLWKNILSMNYQHLQGMTLDNLVDLLAKNTTDLLKAIEKKDKPIVIQLKDEAEMIQELINQKKTLSNSRLRST